MKNTTPQQLIDGIINKMLWLMLMHGAIVVVCTVLLFALFPLVIMLGISPESTNWYYMPFIFGVAMTFVGCLSGGLEDMINRPDRVSERDLELLAFTLPEEWLEELRAYVSRSTSSWLTRQHLQDFVRHRKSEWDEDRAIKLLAKKGTKQ